MDELEDFEFGEMPVDDDLIGREEYDVNNDDTFGADIVADFEHPDLSNYAEQTTALGKRFDELWRVPGRSTDAPDASNVPMPSFNFDDSSFSSMKDNPWDSGSNGLFNLWSSGGSGAAKSVIDHDDTDYILKYMDEVHAARSQQPDRNENQSRQPYTPLRPSDVKNDSTHRVFGFDKRAEQTEGHQRVSSASTNKPLSAAELEQQFLEEARRKNENDQPAIHPTLLAMFQSHDSNAIRKPQMISPQMHAPPLPRQQTMDRPYPPMNGPSLSMPNQPPPPPSGQPPPWAMAIPPQFHKFIPVWFEYALRRIPHLPQGVPPVHPVIIQVLNAQRQAAMNRGPVPSGFNGMPPGPPPMMGPGTYGMNPMQRMHPMQHSDSWRNRPASSMSSMSQRKPPGFPTGKTIEDFAFDPYAGFMSKKEREWLIKIQLLQCLGSGNPYLEDYYYTLWSQKRSGDTDSVNGDDIHEETKKRKEKLVPRNYNAPKFSGSLGKPVSSTTSNPRHLIDVSVHVDSPDDENKKASSRKLKTVLLIVENSVLTLLQCEDKMRHPTHSSESEIEEKMEVLMTHVFTSSMVSKIVNIPKGRRFIAQFMQISPIRYQSRALLAFLDSCSRLTANGRVSTEVMASIGEEVIPSLLHSMLLWSREELIDLSKHLSAETVINDLNAKNTITRDILLSYVYACSVVRAHSSSSIFAFLKGPTSIDWNSFSPSSSMWIKNCKLNKTKVEVFVEWLRLLSHGSTHVAAHLANSILL
ncbi:hypothetical protein PENTCL1PPCAC_6370 [Pristionchus entomophagus]|uniref:Patr-1 n=1 Tax=Pristionchus entomophagus TaxID=358040 RepID=A0AAV5SVU4_9BILA|nr:hypothetical protein PENTCL1PPCAC_6370 [Pristionchus entomophagus]